MNEPVLDYAPGSPERARWSAGSPSSGGPARPTHTIGGREVEGGGEPLDVVQPHNRRSVLGTLRNATTADARAAVNAALAAAPGWRAVPFDERAADLPEGGRPAGRSVAGDAQRRHDARARRKTAYQAEIDSACELIDFWRFNVHFAAQILAEQPIANSKGIWNRTDHRPLEGFVYAITPFNFTAIAGNLPTAPALMGNTVVWKPSPTQAFAAHFTMRLLEAAGLPPGVINMVHRRRARRLRGGAGLAATWPASTSPARRRRSSSSGARSAANIDAYRGYPRIVGETGGKDFVAGAPVGRRRRAAHGAGPRRLRVPGAEVLGGLARLRAALGVDAARGRPRRPTSRR